MTRADLLDLIKVKMDEVSPFTENELISETFADEFIDKASDEVLLKVPLTLIAPDDMPTTEQVENTDGTGFIPVPSDYLRLHSFKMEEWDEAVNITITEQHPKFKLQKFTTTRGKPSKPIVVDMNYKISHTGSAVRVLKYISVCSSHTVTYAYYVKSLGAAFTSIADKLADVTAYQAAGNIFLSQGIAEQAKAMYLKVDEFIKLNQ